MPRVGRLSAVDGTVQYHSPSGEWSGALANEPVAAGTGLRTAAGAQAAWRGPGARVAIAPSSELRILRFDADALQIAVSAGRIGIHLDAAEASKTIEIDLPRGGVWLDAPGDYDIAAGDANRPPAIQVIAGKARPGGGLDDKILAEVNSDSFTDSWRKQDDETDPTIRRRWPGIADLAALGTAGRWERDWDLGRVWYPGDVADDWTPYRDGTWRFLPPWGWTWIADEPWGFAPSHYGRWARIDRKWGWVPGEKLESSDYSPAAVAFLGTAGIGLSRPGDAGPAVAWFPLAPGEHIGAAGDTDGAYQNRRFATAVPRNVFAGGLPVASAVVDDVPEQRFADAPVILQSLDISPAVIPAKKSRLAGAMASIPPEAASAPRPPFVVVLRAAPPPPARPLMTKAKLPPRPLMTEAKLRDIKKRLRVAAAAAIAANARPRALASALRSPHNRQHLAAARGGA